MPKINPVLLDGENYPKGQFEPLHPLFRGTALVERFAFNSDQPPFKVKLGIGECACESGAAWVWFTDRQKGVYRWIPNRYCVHKLKAIADIIEGKGLEDDADAMAAFVKAVATRYNSFEVVSAMHKHLRRGKADSAYFFACILSTTRGIKGIIKYLLAIAYEETRDHALREFLMDLMEREDYTFLSMSKAIAWFCETKKKWDLHEQRIPLFEHEQRGYQKLVKEFGPDVAKASQIIDSDMVQVFQENMLDHLRSGDLDAFQYCIKGIQKSKFPEGITDLHDLRRSTVLKLRPAIKWISNHADQMGALAFCKYLLSKPANPGISYHDLNAFADLLSGEPYAYGTLPDARQRAIRRTKRPLAFPFHKFPNVPLYAHDNHTYRGKALLRQYGGQAVPGVEQTHIDLRGCGAYLGVAWRYYAVAQRGSIGVDWHKVKFPKWLAKHLIDMWY